MSACLTYWRNDSVLILRSRAIAVRDFPLVCTNCTASRRNSGGYGGCDLPMWTSYSYVGNPLPSVQVSTKPGQFHVSSEEQVEGYSLDTQQRAISHYCQAQGWTLAGEYRDEGRSGRTEDLSKRSQFVAMLEDAEAGVFDVIVVHKLDRFARNIR